jgi:hypothetical protein
MRKIVNYLTITVLISFLSPTFGAEYVVQTGESFTTIAKFTGHTVDELLLMNSMSETDTLKPKQKIVWISSTDKLFAMSWFQRVFEDMSSSGDDKALAHTSMDRISNGAVVYDHNPNGIHFIAILAAAKSEIARLNKESGAYLSTE